MGFHFRIKAEIKTMKLWFCLLYSIKLVILHFLTREGQDCVESLSSNQIMSVSSNRPHIASLPINLFDFGNLTK